MNTKKIKRIKYSGLISISLISTFFILSNILTIFILKKPNLFEKLPEFFIKLISAYAAFTTDFFYHLFKGGFSDYKDIFNNGDMAEKAIFISAAVSLAFHLLFSLIFLIIIIIVMIKSFIKHKFVTGSLLLISFLVWISSFALLHFGTLFKIESLKLFDWYIPLVLWLSLILAFVSGIIGAVSELARIKKEKKRLYESTYELDNDQYGFQ
ncbi:hypothetical protein [Mycoplasma sp. Mirounga ES2805-ORL]|uniref:hypothetical protein n=1 Tax=Mycoplasma sp. Mirounga ES2805-ORL TaxID=754514 RepID=UPI00197C06A5|nr:hypothetical protein [Mycoplasma sp. Mirounga ES2805-ORL]QSF13856.1 hypothetical protein JXZ90_00960 [Mycoplasma sp. Mirounga ES2805-ORL]